MGLEVMPKAGASDAFGDVQVIQSTFILLVEFIQQFYISWNKCNFMCKFIKYF